LLGELKRFGKILLASGVRVSGVKVFLSSYKRFEDSLSLRLEFSESKLYFLLEKSRTLQLFKNSSSYFILLVNLLIKSIPPE
jgi:hypothetical protein